MRPIRRLPKTIGEYAGALTAAQEEGAGHALKIFLYIMVDKYSWNQDQVAELMQRVADQSLAISEGYMNPKDIENVLREEYQIIV